MRVEGEMRDIDPENCMIILQRDNNTKYAPKMRGNVRRPTCHKIRRTVVDEKTGAILCRNEYKGEECIDQFVIQENKRFNVCTIFELFLAQDSKRQDNCSPSEESQGNRK